MGYTIIIGQATNDSIDPESENYPVEITEDGDAPVFLRDNATNSTNVRKPMYSEWSDFLQRVGLHELFFNSETGLMRSHPGIETLTIDHYNEINEVYLLMTTFGQDGSKAGLDFIRLAWLRFWTKWAIDNCPNPVIFNT